MKFDFGYKNILKPACLVAALMTCSSASASIINSDFSDGLNNWNADYSYFDGAQEHYYEPVIDFADFTDNFSTGSNSVTLTTSFDDDNEYFGLYLFQQFEVADDAFELSLNVDYHLTDFDIDWASVTLVDENFDVIHDFMNDGLSVNISSLTGSLVSLELGLEDGDFVYGDYLTVSDITMSSVEVPEPSSVALFALAFLALSRRVFTRS